jgi:serine/threonine protein kinase
MDYELRGFYDFNKMLGKGAYGTVIECKRTTDDKLMAIKFLKAKSVNKWVPVKHLRPNIDDEHLKQILFEPNKTMLTENSFIPIEVACLVLASKLIGIVTISQYWTPFYLPEFDQNDGSSSSENVELSQCDSPDENSKDNEKFVAIVFERDASEVTLYEYICQKICENLSESQIKPIFKQIVEISSSLLNLNILHGDIKCENLLINQCTGQIKLIDFGSAVLLDPNHRFHAKTIRSFRGTNPYKPPEFILNHSFYPRTSTVWTFGIMLYDLVCGEFPFPDENAILEHRYRDLSFVNERLSDSLKDLIRCCLRFYAADRIIIDKILNHSWFS